MNIEYIKSIYRFDEYRPFGLPEFAFGGRSNAGKSSLINATFGAKIAHTGKKPGKTRCVNFFRVDGKYVLADLPGYGYAKVSRDMQDDWKALVESYVERSPRLRRVFILADVQRGIQDEERMLAEWLDHIGRPYTVVFTKIDKISRNALASVRRAHGSISPVFFSAHTGEGKNDILKLIGGDRVS